MARKVSLLEILRTTPCVRSGPKTWFDNLDEDTKEQLLAVRQEYQENAGKYSKSHVFNAVSSAMTLPVKQGSFARWLEEKPNG